MARVGILSPSLTFGDAVSNDAVGMYEVLMRRGHEVRLFCEANGLKSQKVYDARKIGKFLTNAEDILIYHHSRGWAAGIHILMNVICRTIIKYHNVTPAEFFEGYSSSDAQLCRMGRMELAAVAKANCDLYLSASAFNMRELIAVGAEQSRSFVVPPFHHVDRLQEVTANDAIVQKYDDNKTNILTVGRVAPHKSHITLLEAFANYYYNYNRESRLIVVGKGGEGLTAYSKLLHRAIRSLGLIDAVVLTGGVTDEELKAYYLIADVFVTVSEHEGFCVPLVEAMSMKLPIVSFASTAIPETLGDAGLSWTERDPLLIAESIHVIMQNDSIRTGLGLRGFRRYAAMFTNRKIENTFHSALTHMS